MSAISLTVHEPGDPTGNTITYSMHSGDGNRADSGAQVAERQRPGKVSSACTWPTPATPSRSSNDGAAHYFDKSRAEHPPDPRDRHLRHYGSGSHRRGVGLRVAA